MARHQKENTKKQKIIMYAVTAAAAIIAALGVCFFLVSLVVKPTEFAVNDVERKTLADFKDVTTPDFVYTPEAAILVTKDGAKNSIDKIVSAAAGVKAADGNKVIVLNCTVNTENLIKRKAKIDVAYLPQKPELQSGSEITALTTVLNHFGYNVSKTEMSENFLEKTGDALGDFNEVYVGDPAKKGFGCYAKPIVTAANKYLATQDKAYEAINYSGKKFEELLKQVEKGNPVIIWGTTYNDKTKTLNEPYSSIQWTLNDKNYTWISPEHCMVLIGYDLDTNVAIVSDPLRGIVEYDLDTVKARYLALNSQCVTFERKPIITGIENGVTYYTTQCVSILNHNFKSITLNGNDVEDVFLIHGNKEDTYRVTIIEANDNVIEYLIYTKPISSLFDALEGANEFSVTNNHLDDINNIKDTLSSVTTDYCSPEESKTIENSLMICDVMIENITQANSKYDEIFNIVESFKETPPTDATELTKQLENIMALASNQNLTVEQKTHLTQMQDLCNQYLKEINPIR